jgi:hypothetical protein
VHRPDERTIARTGYVWPSVPLTLAHNSKADGAWVCVATDGLCLVPHASRFPHWLKVKNPNAPAVKREAEEDWAADANCRDSVRKLSRPVAMVGRLPTGGDPCPAA